ncbi:MAG: SIS domain-containing protein [Bacillota bacterium]
MAKDKQASRHEQMPRDESSPQDDVLRTVHPFRMWDAVMETPGVIRRCLEPELSGPAMAAGKAMADRGLHRVFLLGCGSSNYAAISTTYALGDLAGMDADTYDAFEFINYRLGTVSKETGVITFSHSGNTKVTVDAAELVRERGAFTVCLTDVPEALLAKHADVVVPVGGGKEPVEPKTRSFINTVVMGYQLAAAAGGKAVMQELRRIPELLEECMALEGQARVLATKYAGIKRVFVVGGGPNYATALEIALKFKEAVLLAGEGLEVEEAFHGPIASLDQHTLVITVSAPGPSYERVGHFARAASMIGSPVISVTSEPYAIDGIDTIRVPLGGVRETFSNSVLVYPLYMLSYYSALVRGNNPDVFRIGDQAFHGAMSAVPSVSYSE